MTYFENIQVLTFNLLQNWFYIWKEDSFCFATKTHALSWKVFLVLYTNKLWQPVKFYYLKTEDSVFFNLGCFWLHNFFLSH
jgi:hypothetical protein